MGENVVNTHASSFSIGSSSFLKITRSTMKILNVFKISQIRLRTADVAALEPLKTSPIYLLLGNWCTSFYRAFYIASVLVRKQDRHNVRICLKFGRVWPQIAELAAFECQKLYEENINS